MGRHYMSQNFLGIMDFDLKFTYVLAGWEESVHHASIVADRMSRPDTTRNGLTSDLLLVTLEKIVINL
jgi:hypothetical protein